MAKVIKNAIESAAAPQAAVAQDLSLDSLTKERDAYRIVASEAVKQLLDIENKFAPLLSKKINLLSILSHWKEFLLLIGEVIGLIKDFKQKFLNPPSGSAQ